MSYRLRDMGAWKSETGEKEWAIAIAAGRQALRIERLKGASDARARDVVEIVLSACSGFASGERPFDRALAAVYRGEL